MATAVLIPIKSFDLAKGRLGEAVAPDDRAALARRMAATVISAARDLPTWIVCGDRDVAAFSTRHGANVIWREPRGLNRAVTEGVEFLAAEGFSRVIISHADLPLAADLTWLADPERVDGAGVTLVPDRRNDGSNVLVVPTGTGFTFAYGPGSAAAHEAEAERVGLPFCSIPDPALGWDIDVPADLAVFGDDDLSNPTIPISEATS